MEVLGLVRLLGRHVGFVCGVQGFEVASRFDLGPPVALLGL